MRELSIREIQASPARLEQLLEQEGEIDHYA